MPVVIRKLVLELSSRAQVLTKLEEGAVATQVAPALPRSPGRPVPAIARAALAPVVGSVPQARIHTDAVADRAAQSLGARAFTLGNDIYFRSGAFDTSSAGGLSLLGHELTHVRQAQRSILRKPSGFSIGNSNQYEAEAERNEAKIRDFLGGGLRRKALGVGGASAGNIRRSPIRRSSMDDPWSSAGGATQGIAGHAKIRIGRLTVSFADTVRASRLRGPTDLALASERRLAFRSPLERIRPKQQVRTKEEEQARAAGAKGGSLDADIASSTGSPLSSDARRFFEPAFGTSFADVRVHVDSSAARAAQSIRAEAFTLGSHVYFNQGYFSTSSPRGIALLGHELTHVAQNRGGAKTLSAKSLEDSTYAARGLVDALSAGESMPVHPQVAYAKAEEILRSALEGDRTGRLEGAVGKLAAQLRRKELTVAPHDRYEDQAIHNERVIYVSLSGASGSQLGLGGDNGAAGGDGLRLRAKALEGLIRRSDGTATGSPPEVRRAEPPSDMEKQVLAEEGVQSSSGGFLDKIVGFFKSLGGPLGTVADIAISLLPVVGNIYSAACGLIGRQIIGWEPLGIFGRILSLAGAIPLPGTALGQKVGKLIDKLGSKSRFMKPVFKYLAGVYKEFAPKAMSALSGLWSRFSTTIVGKWFQKGVDFAAKFANYLRLPGTAAARQYKALPGLMEKLWHSRIDKLKKAGLKPEEIEKILAEASGDVRKLFSETVPGFGQKFNVNNAVQTAEKHGLTIVHETADSYNAAVKAAGGADAIAIGGVKDLVHYGELPKGAAGGAALAAQDAAYLLYKEGGSEWISRIFHLNPVEIHEYSHVLQYMYFQKVFQRLEHAGAKLGVEGLGLAGHELRTMQGWLEMVQKPAMEGMAYLFASPFGKKWKGSILDKFMGDAGRNLAAGNFNRWSSSLAALEGLRSAIHMQMFSMLAFGLMGLGLDMATGGGTPIATMLGMIAGLGNKGVLIGMVRALGLMRKERAGLGHDPLEDLAGERSPREQRRLQNRIGRALEELDKPGLPLEYSLREKLEAASGVSLGDVRIHVGADAERLADAVGAEAFTLGNRIVFGRGSFSPDTAEGLGTLVHEATHVGQFQSGRLAGPASPVRTAALETEAYARESSFLAGARGLYAAAPAAVYREAVDGGMVAPAPAAIVGGGSTAPAPVSPRVAGALPSSAIQAKGRVLRKESAQRDPVQALMDQHKIEAISQEEFLEICTERLMDLMKDELASDAERRETLAWNYDRPLT